VDAPIPPEIESGSPCFYDESRHALTVVEMTSYPARLWRMADDAPGTWTSIDIGGATSAYYRSPNWTYDAAHDRLLMAGTAFEKPPCGSDTARVYIYLEGYQLSLGGTPHWDKVPVVERPFERYEYATAYDSKRNRFLVALGEESSQSGSSVAATVAALELDGDPHWTVLPVPGPPLARNC